MILAVGPFLGSFEQEIVTFRPYAKWLHDIVPHDKMYISTHSNRKFLYDFVPERNIVPVFNYITDNEISQKGYVHEYVTLKKFNIMARFFKKSIMEEEQCGFSDIKIYNISYAKTTPHYPIYNKVFTPIKSDEDTSKNEIVFIPYGQSRKSLTKIHDRFKGRVKVVGDLKCCLDDHNDIIKDENYSKTGLKSIIQYITNAKLVVCPISFWTLISNIQAVDVFSWGDGIGPYIEDGIYNFGNKKANVYAINDPNEVINLLEDFLIDHKYI
jgi:hypothetical protein